MTDYAELYKTTISMARKAYEKSNPFALQMYFTYMQDTDIRGLLAWSDDDSKWEPKTYPDDIIKFRLVADCMLRYYYNLFRNESNEIEWEEDTDDSISYDKDKNYDSQFAENKEFWIRISEDESQPKYPYMDIEDQDEVAFYEAFTEMQERQQKQAKQDSDKKTVRPRFFSIEAPYS